MYGIGEKKSTMSNATAIQIGTKSDVDRFGLFCFDWYASSRMFVFVMIMILKVCSVSRRQSSNRSMMDLVNLAPIDDSLEFDMQPMEDSFCYDLDYCRRMGLRVSDL